MVGRASEENTGKAGGGALRKTRLVVIVGPTAVGKTAAGVLLARRIGGEVVSADSMQVYRGLDVGTAKLTPDEAHGVPHHLIDVADPDEEFTVADYQELATRAIEGIVERGRFPIVVGGTGLYIRALVDGFLFPEPEGDPALREVLVRWADEHGLPALHERLATVDPVAAARIHPNDRRRLIRALEVYHKTGRPITELQNAGRAEEPVYDTLFCGLTMNREELYRRINERVHDQLRRGLLDEVKRLVASGRARILTAGQALGYKEFLRHLSGEESLDTAVERLKQATRRYAKRQYTWFRADKRVEWFDLDEVDGVPGAVSGIIELMAGRWPDLAKDVLRWEREALPFEGGWDNDEQSPGELAGRFSKPGAQGGNPGHDPSH